MAIGTVSFYKFNGSLSTGEYPLVSGNETATHTIANVGYQVGLQTEIKVPSFTGYDTVNVAKIDGNYYWITAFYERTNANGQIFFTLDYMGPTSMIKRNDSMTAYLERSPTYLCDYLTDSWTKGISVLNVNDAEEIGYRMSDYYSDPLYWVQITGVDNQGDYHRYGCFVKAVSSGEFSDPIIDRSCLSPNGAYPSILDIMNNIADFTPFTADTVKDISISARAPYNYVLVDVQQGLTTLRTVALGTPGTPPSHIDPTQNGNGSLLTYDIDTLVSNQTIPIIDEKTITFTATDAIKLSGNYVIRDWNKNIIATFPVAEGSTFYCQTYADYSGIYTIITNETRLITIPEGKLPYAGSGWDNYRAYDMVADRQQMLNSINYAEKERQTELIGGTAESLATGALTGALAGGPVGLGVGMITSGISSIGNIAGSNVKRELETNKALDELKLKELRAKTSPGTGYNTSYGIIYVTLTADDYNLIIGPELPLNDASTLLTDYTDRIGYPCEGKHTITAGNGYYQGYMPAGSGSGMYFNEFNRVFRQGFKFITP